MTNVFGALMRKIRTERGLTLRDVGAILGVSHVYVGEVERGDRAPMARARIARFAEELVASEIELVVAAAQQRGAIDVGGLTPGQIAAIARYAESLRANRT